MDGRLFKNNMKPQIYVGKFSPVELNQGSVKKRSISFSHRLSVYHQRLCCLMLPQGLNSKLYRTCYPEDISQRKNKALVNPTMEISESCKLSQSPLLHKFIGLQANQLLFMSAFIVSSCHCEGPLFVLFVLFQSRVNKRGGGPDLIRNPF